VSFARSARIVHLFFTTIVKRVSAAVIGVPIRETADADGTYRTLVVKRPGVDCPQERADYDAIRRDLQRRGEMRAFSFPIRAGIATALILSLQIWVMIGGGFLSLLLLAPVLVLAGTFAITWWHRANTLTISNALIAAAWLRNGNCPHCAYRLPPRDPSVQHPRARCSECGTEWNAILVLINPAGPPATARR
jgi:hypothetical protein